MFLKNAKDAFIKAYPYFFTAIGGITGGVLTPILLKNINPKDSQKSYLALEVITGAAGGALIGLGLAGVYFAFAKLCKHLPSTHQNEQENAGILESAQPSASGYGTMSINSQP